ncbi:MAG: cell wall metabolism sensor histidine kinase WalK, partial [Actinomycetota bacterium]|nr:cell wall metabolism sensor histidine kinase WalK [Actinomycetota bacterium]
MSLVGISAVTSLIVGLVLYYFAGSRLIEVEGSLLIQRSRTANAGAEEFLNGLRDPADRSLPPADTYAEELVRSVSDFTGLGVLYTTPGGEPLAARDTQGETVPPEEAYRRLDLDQETIARALEDGNGRLVPREGRTRYVAVWPLKAADGDVRGALVYNASQEGLRQTLSYLRYGIIGSIGASILLAGIASLILAREITRPLSKTRDAAIRVASGDYAPVPVEREDELGEVARAFNYMVAEVEHYIGEIQEQKSRLEAVLEASPEAVVAIDPEERVTMANPAAARMLGIQAADHGRKLENTSVPAEILHCVRESSATGVAVREIELGENSYWTYAAQMNRDDPDQNGGSTGVILAVRDITEHRSLERAKTNFVSDVSHELRTPLTTIQSAVDLVERARDRMEPLEHRALELANQELKRIRGMVEELLVLAQVDSWQYSLEVAPTNLNSVLQNSVESLQAKAERFGIEIHFDDEAGYRCVCDAQKLYQVFLNILDNAIKYSDPGARVDISIEEADSSLTVQISDTGVGIP